LGRPELAAQLGLSPQVGWDSAVAGECSLADALIESQADGITILPLVSSHPADGLPTLQKGGVLEQLRATFDILLIDAGALPTDGSGEASSPAIRQLADACLLVKKQAAGTRLVQQACHQLEQWNIPLVGLIENRCRV
jgi:MinD-like ATPase involved in chromosome partitioning or flagellar assembly